MERPVLSRQEAIQTFKDEKERKFAMQKGLNHTRVHVIGTPLGRLANPPLHQEITKKMLEKGIYTEPENIRGGYLKVEGEELLFWGPSNVPILSATDQEFQEAVDKYGIEIVDHLLGIEKSQGKK
jgi:hypothetical protein